jgi:hypothetical protein
MAQFIYWRHQPLPPHAICACGECRQSALEDDGHGGWVCQCCNPPPNRNKRVDQCPSCGRTHAPAEDHHPFGQRLQKFLGIPKLTIRICRNCHAELSAYLLPLVLIQRLVFTRELEKNLINKIGCFLFVLIFVCGYDAYEAEDPYRARHFREDANFLLRNLKDCTNV